MGELRKRLKPSRNHLFRVQGHYLSYRSGKSHLRSCYKRQTKEGVKQCTKCKRFLPFDCFWKPPARKGKHYPSCIECELETKARKLGKNPLCFVCNERPHMKGSRNCYPCDRMKTGKGEKRWVSRKVGLEWCKVCELRPRLPYHHWCLICRNEYQRNNRSKKWSERYATKPERKIVVARAYANGLLQRGKIKRGPCVFCEIQSTEFHHYDYIPRTRNFDDVCSPCHDDVHRFLRIMLTIYKIMM